MTYDLLKFVHLLGALKPDTWTLLRAGSCGVGASQP